MSRNERKDIAVMTSLPYNDSLDDIENIPRPIIRHQRLIKVKYDLHNAYICDIPVSKQPNICIKRRHIRRNIKAKSVLCNSLNQNRSSIPTNQNLKNCLGSLNNKMSWGPEKSAAFLDVVDMRLPLYRVQS